MNIAIVTGAYGYIGSVLTKVLKEHGHYVFGVDNDPNALKDWLSNKQQRTKYCDDFVANCFASQDVLHLIEKYPTATIYHLAANSLLGPSATEPLKYFENNTAKTLTLLQHLRPTNKLVFASTAAVYGLTNKRSVRETDKLDPPNNYGLSKLWSEQMFDKYYELGNMKITSFRFFNVIGAYGDVGQQKGTPHIINKLCEAAAKNIPFEIYGDDYETADGTCVRDYVHVLDICGALIHATEYMDKLEIPCHLKYNLGTKSGVTVKEIVEKFQLISQNRNFLVEIVDRRIGDPAYLVANPSKFIKETKFKYKHSSDLHEMIRSAWEYYK
jgi:UDP-glucose 4-epimerase